MNKRLIALLGIAWLWCINVVAQSPPQNWFLLDPKIDHVYGVSAERAYNELLQGKTSTTVVVAVIDGGVDVKHEDLKNKIWINPKEIPDNKTDDDHNGYIDDMYGWNFIGGKDSDVQYDQFELTRLYKQLHDKFGGNTSASATTGNTEYDRYLKITKHVLYLRHWPNIRENFWVAHGPTVIKAYEGHGAVPSYKTGARSETLRAIQGFPGDKSSEGYRLLDQILRGLDPARIPDHWI